MGYVHLLHPALLLTGDNVHEDDTSAHAYNCVKLPFKSFNSHYSYYLALYNT